MIHESPWFLKRGNKLQSICMSHTIRTELRLAQIDFRHVELTAGEMIRVDSIESTRIDNIFNPPSKPRSG